MKVLVDTSVWSLALRRNNQDANAYVELLKDLILDGRVAMIGAIRQELLSGIRREEQCEQLRSAMRSFPDLELTETDYEAAAASFNLCRRKGIQGSNTDFLICAVANQRDLFVLTADKDFENYSKHLKVRLLNPKPKTKES